MFFVFCCCFSDRGRNIQIIYFQCPKYFKIPVADLLKHFCRTKLWPRGYKTFILLINVKMPTIVGIFNIC